MVEGKVPLISSKEQKNRVIFHVVSDLTNYPILKIMYDMMDTKTRDEQLNTIKNLMGSEAAKSLECSIQRMLDAGVLTVEKIKDAEGKEVEDKTKPYKFGSESYSAFNRMKAQLEL